MRIIDADALLEKLRKTDRYFMVKFDIESVPTVELQMGRMTNGIIIPRVRIIDLVTDERSKRMSIYDLDLPTRVIIGLVVLILALQGFKR